VVERNGLSPPGSSQPRRLARRIAHGTTTSAAVNREKVAEIG
jgi:hypothetical protein